MQKKNLNIEKIAFKVVQIKFLAMHITNQKLSFDILQNIFMQHELYLIFGIKKKDNFDVFLAIATNIAVLLMTAFVILIV